MKNIKNHKFNQYPTSVTSFSSISENIVKAVCDLEEDAAPKKDGVITTGFYDKLDYIYMLLSMDLNFSASNLEMTRIDMNKEDFDEIYDFNKLTEKEIEIMNRNVCASYDIPKNTVDIYFKKK